MFVFISFLDYLSQTKLGFGFDDM